MFTELGDRGGEIKPFNLLVAGVGNAGCNVLNAIDASGKPVPYSIAIHTSHQRLSQAKVMRSVQIGASVTEGASCGGDLKLGRICAESDEDMLRELFSGYELVVFVAGLGGGTGSGATPVLIRLAREMGCFTLCLATLPFRFEADDKRRIADMGLAAIQEQAHATICFPNERLIEHLGGRKDLKRGIRAIESYFSDVVLGLWDMLNQRGLIHLDFSDLTNLVGHSDGAGADLSLDDIEELVKKLSSRSREDVKIAVGVNVDGTLGDRVEVMLVTSELWVRSKMPDRTVASVAATAASEEPQAGAAADGGSLVQSEIALDTPAGQGKFANVAPTVHDGEDLDVPTFIRRGVKLSRTY